MRVRQNVLIKALLGVMIFVPIYFIATNKDESNQNGESGQSSNGDNVQLVTPSEEIAALSGYVTKVEQELEKANEKLGKAVTEEDIAKLLNNAKGDSQTIDNMALSDQINSLVEERFNSFKKEVVENGVIVPSEAGDIDEEMPFGDAFEINGESDSEFDSSPGSNDEFVWEYPVGIDVEESGGIASILEENPLGEAFKGASDGVKKGISESAQVLENELRPIPFLTLPPDSSIHGAKSLNALVGRIERKGRTHDPFTFQIMLSGDTLIANGHNASGVRNAMVSGAAIGDWAGSCVRGRITSFTLVFDDGRIFNQKGSYEEPLAVLGDKWGNPCIGGVRVDDIERFVGMQGAISGLASVADQIAKQQQSLRSSDGRDSIELSGSAGKLAAGSFVSGSLGQTQEVLAERYESYYEAIYVKPGAVVSMLIEQMIAVDYIPTNRKVNYENFSISHRPLD